MSRTGHAFLCRFKRCLWKMSRLFCTCYQLFPFWVLSGLSVPQPTTGRGPSPCRWYSEQSSALAVQGPAELHSQIVHCNPTSACTCERGGDGEGWEGWWVVIRGNFEAEPGFPKPIKISGAQEEILPLATPCLELALPLGQSPPAAFWSSSMSH